MQIYGPLHICAYLFGVFPAVADTGRFRVHWPGLALKAFQTVFYWLVSLVVGVTSIRNLLNYQKLTKKILTTRVLDIDELFVYMMFAGMAATAACQAHMLWPSVARAVNECFFDLCPSHDGVTGVWQFCSAFGILLFVAYELAMYYFLITYKFTFASAKLICLFPPLSNITCIVIEQFFYLMCISLYLRLRILHNDIKTLVHKAEHPRWRCRVAGGGEAGPVAPVGIPAFSVSDIRDLRAVHRACMELFARINFLFQLPLSLCMFDCMFRIVVYMYGVAFEVTIVIWEKKKHINYVNTALWTGYCVVRVVRLWYLHMCEHYVTKKIIPMRLSLSWLSLILNPITSRRLIPEIILFQHQLDVIKSKFEIFGVLNINMALFYAGFGTTLAYIALLLQLFAFNQISMATISSSLSNGTSPDN
ncbi:7TM chemoreceptor [Cinara cedri]|uniref:Gustatory receptor n=1 Tax=Cinara cedri TaxID=506608 RepID=A0A5E4NI14_9HEMI|nr:7TM chemoreceptor [Cinara cedri]